MTEENHGLLARPQESMESDNMSPDALTAELMRRQAPAEESQAASDDTNDTSESIVEEMDGDAEPEKAEPEVTEEAAEESPEEEQPDDEPEPSEDEEVLSQDSKQHKGLEKRVAKLTARAKTAEEANSSLKSELAALQAKVTELTSQPPKAVAADPADPLRNITSSDDLEKRRSQAREVRRVVQEALDEEGDELEVAGKTYERSELKRILRDAQQDIEERIPAREKWLELRSQVEANTASVFPWYKDKSSPEYQNIQTALRQDPALNRVAGAPGLLALAAKGAMALKAEQKAAEEAKKKPKAPAPKPPPVDTGGVVPSKRASTSNNKRKSDELRRRVTSTNMSSDDVTNLMLQRELDRESS